MRLNQITIPSLHVEAATSFYETLGMQPIVKAFPHYARLMCPEDQSTFSIHQVERLPTGEGIYVYFECDDLDTFIDSLVEKGIQFDELPNDKPWLWREARLKDPDQNQLIFYFAGENRLSPPWKVES